MSAYEDKRLASRFAAVAQEPLPGDWDDVLGKAGSGRIGRKWRDRSREGRRRRRIVVLAAAALVVAGTASAFGTVREFVLDRGFIGLPPQGATPSAPESGELVVHYTGRSATLPGRYGGPIVSAWVYADGRIIWSQRLSGRGRIPEGANELTSGYLEQRLMPEGVELVRSEVAALFGRTRTLLDTVPAPSDDDPRPGPFPESSLILPPDSGFLWGSVEVPEGDRLVRLAWGLNDPRDTFEGTTAIATTEQLSALRRVDALLTDPASVLPSTAWAVRKVRAYVPSHYGVCIDTSPPKDSSDLLSLLPTAAADVLRDKSRTRLDGKVLEAREAGHIVVLGRSVTYCSKLTTEEARDVVAALDGANLPRSHDILAYRLAEAANNLNPTTIWFEPYLPHGRFTYSLGG